MQPTTYRLLLSGKGVVGRPFLLATFQVESPLTRPFFLLLRSMQRTNCCREWVVVMHFVLLGKVRRGKKPVTSCTLHSRDRKFHIETKKWAESDVCVFSFLRLFHYCTGEYEEKVKKTYT